MYCWKKGNKKKIKLLGLQSYNTPHTKQNYQKIKIKNWKSKVSLMITSLENNGRKSKCAKEKWSKGQHRYPLIKEAGVVHPHLHFYLFKSTYSNVNYCIGCV